MNYPEQISVSPTEVKPAPLIPDVKRRLTDLLLILTILITAATIVIQVCGFHFGSQEGILSLRTVAPLSDTPLFMVESAPGARYLRGAVGSIYDGEEWHLEKARGQDVNIRSGRKGLLLRPAEFSRSYHDYNGELLNESLIIDNPRYLDLPNDIPARVKNLSLQITRGFVTPFEKAKAIETFLHFNYTYNMNFTPAPSSWEPNDWFLFESKEGICGNFASAFVVLARYSGLPARLAAGYFVQPGKGEQAVYENQAHAWAEVGFDGLGWLAFDAT